MRWGIREIHEGEIQTVGDTSPISVGQDLMRRGIRDYHSTLSDEALSRQVGAWCLGSELSNEALYRRVGAWSHGSTLSDEALSRRAGAWCLELRRTHGAETQTSGDGSPTSVS